MIDTNKQILNLNQFHYLYNKLDNLTMGIEFNTNIKLLAGGHFCGNTVWNKNATSIDNCFKLYFIRKGKAVIKGKNRSTELHENAIYFLNGYHLVSQICIDPIIVDWVHFLPQSLYFNHILKTLPCVMEIPKQQLSSFLDFFSHFDSYFNYRLDNKEERIVQLEIQALLYFVISQIFRTIETDKFSSNDRLQRLLPSLDYISENYKSQIALEQLAAKTYLSPNYFHRLFTSEFKVTPLNYIKSIRMDEAMRQLVYTTFPVKQIAYNVGYDDEAYFNRVFKNNNKISPGQFRKLYAKKKP